ncbi:anti-repressor SinI family protein [Priestia megaterium]
MMKLKEENDILLPEEWIALVKEAMKLNISKEQFKEFLESYSTNKDK